MCTAISSVGKIHLFGRTLDWEHSFGEEIIITKKHTVSEKGCYSVIGTGINCDGYPLYFDGFNEKGLAVAGLSFPEAVYNENEAWKENIPSYDVTFRILSECASVVEASSFLKNANITNKAFSRELSPSPLHWIISDYYNCIVLEQTENGLKLYENPLRVLTNSPPFSYHILRTAELCGISSASKENTFAPGKSPDAYGRGFGAIGLPGDYSSSSRFLRAAFLNNNCLLEDGEAGIDGFFRIMGSVTVPEGAVVGREGKEKTLYTSCCDINNLTYYVKKCGSLTIEKRML